jgi:sorting nexin-29
MNRKLDWTVQFIKKGDKLACQNYRGIAVLNVSYKILWVMFVKRINVYAEDVLGEYQRGFRSKRSTLYQIINVRQILEKCYEYNANIHKLFIV